MGVEDLYIDPLSLDEFSRTLRARLDEALAALLRVDQSVGVMAAPALGEFDDAQRTAQQHQRLSGEYADRVRRLAATLDAATTATTGIAGRFRQVEEINTKNVLDALQPVTESLRHGNPHG
jgi:septal ring factor EnvC (AmiA/AmiB activator)